MHTHETQSRRESCEFSFSHLTLILIIIIIIIIIIINTVWHDFLLKFNFVDWATIFHFVGTYFCDYGKCVFLAGY